MVGLLLLSSALGEEKRLELVLKPVALVRASRVKLADVCELPAGSDQTDRRLLETPIAPAPPAGTVVTWFRDDLARRLSGLLDQEVVVSGAEAVYVTVDAEVVRPSDVAAAAEAWLAERTPVPTAKLGLRAHVLLHRPIYVPRYAGAVELTVQPRTVATRTGRLRVDVLVSAGGRLVSRIPVYFEPGGGAVSDRPAQKGIRQVAAETAAVPAPAAPVIERRQPVKIRVRLGALSVIARGLALEPGRVGEFIRVRNTRSGRVLTARVVDGETVEIPF